MFKRKESPTDTAFLLAITISLFIAFYLANKTFFRIKYHFMANKLMKFDANSSIVQIAIEIEDIRFDDGIDASK